jgi:hypothetical protein
MICEPGGQIAWPPFLLPVHLLCTSAKLEHKIVVKVPAMVCA